MWIARVGHFMLISSHDLIGSIQSRTTNIFDSERTPHEELLKFLGR